MNLKILTLNIWQGGLLFDQIINFITSERPDIVTLQEVFDTEEKDLPQNYSSLENLTEELYFTYFDFAKTFEGFVEGKKVVQGNLILSNFPILESSHTFYDIAFQNIDFQNRENATNLPRLLQYATIDANGLDLRVFNTHGIWGEDGLDNLRRLKMSQTIVEKFQGLSHVILAGDFNVNSNTESIKNIEKYLRNVFKDELKTSFNLRRKGIHEGNYFKSVVDNIFVSPDIEVLDHRCPLVDISDHLPLVATVEL